MKELIVWASIPWAPWARICSKALRAPLTASLIPSIACNPPQYQHYWTTHIFFIVFNKRFFFCIVSKWWFDETAGYFSTFTIIKAHFSVSYRILVVTFVQFFISLLSAQVNGSLWITPNRQQFSAFQEKKTLFCSAYTFYSPVAFCCCCCSFNEYFDFILQIFFLLWKMVLTLASVEDEYKKFSQLKKDEVLKIQDWYQKQPHLPNITGKLQHGDGFHLFILNGI